MKTQEHRFAVLGAGSWGTALAMLLARNGHHIRLWGKDQDHVLQMRDEGENSRYLPDYPFPSNLYVYHDLDACLEGITDILIVVPSFAFRETLLRIKPYVSQKTRIVWGTKGLDSGNQLLHEVVVEVLQQT